MQPSTRYDTLVGVDGRRDFSRVIQDASRRASRDPRRRSDTRRPAVGRECLQRLGSDGQSTVRDIGNRSLEARSPRTRAMGDGNNTNRDRAAARTC